MTYSYVYTFTNTVYTILFYMIFHIRVHRPIRRRLMLKLEHITAIIFYFGNGIRTSDFTVLASCLKSGLNCYHSTLWVKNTLPINVYWTVHHLDSWVKRDQLDVTCFIISLFNAQHVSDVNTCTLRSLRLICWVISWVVLIWFDVCWCYVVVWLWWCGMYYHPKHVEH